VAQSVSASYALSLSFSRSLPSQRLVVRNRSYPFFFNIFWHVFLFSAHELCFDVGVRRLFNVIWSSLNDVAVGTHFRRIYDHFPTSKIVVFTTSLRPTFAHWVMASFTVVSTFIFGIMDFGDFLRLSNGIFYRKICIFYCIFSRRASLPYFRRILFFLVHPQEKYSTDPLFHAQWASPPLPFF